MAADANPPMKWNKFEPWPNDDPRMILARKKISRAEGIIDIQRETYESD